MPSYQGASFKTVREGGKGGGELLGLDDTYRDHFWGPLCRGCH